MKENKEEQRRNREEHLRRMAADADAAREEEAARHAAESHWEAPVDSNPSIFSQPAAQQPAVQQPDARVEAPVEAEVSPGPFPFPFPDPQPVVQQPDAPVGLPHQQSQGFTMPPVPGQLPLPAHAPAPRQAQVPIETISVLHTGQPFTSAHGSGGFGLPALSGVTGMNLAVKEMPIELAVEMAVDTEDASSDEPKDMPMTDAADEDVDVDMMDVEEEKRDAKMCDVLDKEQRDEMKSSFNTLEIAVDTEMRDEPEEDSHMEDTPTTPSTGAALAWVTGEKPYLSPRVALYRAEEELATRRGRKFHPPSPYEGTPTAPAAPSGSGFGVSQTSSAFASPNVFGGTPNTPATHFGHAAPTTAAWGTSPAANGHSPFGQSTTAQSFPARDASHRASSNSFAPASPSPFGLLNSSTGAFQNSQAATNTGAWNTSPADGRNCSAASQPFTPRDDNQARASQGSSTGGGGLYSKLSANALSFLGKNTATERASNSAEASRRFASSGPGPSPTPFTPQAATNTGAWGNSPTDGRNCSAASQSFAPQDGPNTPSQGFPAGGGFSSSGPSPFTNPQAASNTGPWNTSPSPGGPSSSGLSPNALSFLGKSTSTGEASNSATASRRFAYSGPSPSTTTPQAATSTGAWNSSPSPGGFPSSGHGLSSSPFTTTQAAPDTAARGFTTEAQSFLHLSAAREASTPSGPPPRIVITPPRTYPQQFFTDEEQEAIDAQIFGELPPESDEDELARVDSLLGLGPTKDQGQPYQGPPAVDRRLKRVRELD